MKPEPRSFYEQAVQRAIDEIVVNLDEALELETLAKGACLLPYHFHRMFRGMVGETPLELVRRLRMEAGGAAGAGQRPADHADRLRRRLRDARVFARQPECVRG
jgi:methylphosphotriester-DNA--protein-cysteine methyltransferase